MDTTLEVLLELALNRSEDYVRACLADSRNATQQEADKFRIYKMASGNALEVLAAMHEYRLKYASDYK